MRTSTKLGLGLLAGVGVSYAARSWLRGRRRIELPGRVVVITGAANGLGLLVAREAARRGARLALVDQDGEGVDRAARELVGEGAPEALAVPIDVADRDAVEAMMAGVVGRFGRVDVLINNAALMMVAPLESVTLDDLRRVLGVNFWGGVYCTLAALPHMRAQGGGRIGNVVSIGGRIAPPHMLPYSAAKFAFSGFTKGIQSELADENILVTGFYPAMIRTGGHTHALIKGDREAEYAWFAAGDVTPITASSAHAAAVRFLQAICDGDPEAPVSAAARLGPIVEAIAPGWFAELNALVERSLPRAETALQRRGPAVPGSQIPGRIPEFLSRLVPDRARPD
ncbi:SDR family NAD(P)-dependent oxidoreductase [Tautonia plasticadhaerens]|uniref:Oxidoreductase SadH n=1 Tax=Tautonia plasticadhaerens TaxID=2527974 RepID=A0A518H4K7_9BACT|nr:SDR family NAD(P)-dependent oxidoreductase [Tautonia plasticadhaerens]QDV35768.1 Putative oxidoreductase SadH [Tautonia plasticadhaerens]